MKIKVTEADMQAAYYRMHFHGWEKFMAEARQQAAARLLAANSAEQKRLCEESSALVQRPHTHEEFRRTQDRLDRLFTEHEQLLDAAYPRVKGPAE